ncbi:serine kinase [Spirosoma utsteinense]|uniref:Serine kinase n=1 Tax=Spirosoma utsteinense TaxID=2585773 RepID=A0ABR6W8D2_9BACT|nr:serine kinase [Spirosoma utsteinense]MBC3784077.1 hypothetical protein [Spirosoma utsteinense]MBC3792834.1 hypothetical protein [Spirosoma utsteinense]
MSYYYRAYGLSIVSDFLLPPLPAGPPATVTDLTIRRGQLPARPSFVGSKAYRAGINAQFAQTEQGDLWLDWPPLISFMALNGNELIVDTTQTDDQVISLFTLSEALGLILFQKGYFLLHGSAVRIGNEGVVFLGEPGAGKSTTVAAFAGKGSRVISDDMVCIRLSMTGDHQLIPAFSQLKIWESSVIGLQLQQESMTPVREGMDKYSWHESIAFEEKAVPLKQIFVLLPPNEPGRVDSPLPSSQVPVELLHHFPLPDALLTGKGLKDYFEKSVALARTTPLFRMSRPADFAALHTFVDQLNAIG